MIEIYDHELDAIFVVQYKLQERARERSHNYAAFEREITERFAEIGFTVEVNWHAYSMHGLAQDGAMPEVTITGRTDPSFTWDPDLQVHEVTANILDIPGQEGVIKSNASPHPGSR